ncbi:MAG: M1 family aminopeptidase [Reichenbachiella sp.]
MRIFFLLIISLIINASAVFAQVDEDQVKIIEIPLDYQSSKTRYFDLLHTELNVSFDWKNEEMNGVAKLRLKPYFYAQDAIALDAKSMQVNSVSMINGDSQISLEFDYDGKQIAISLDQIYQRTDTFELVIDYVSKPNDVITKGSEAITSDQGLYFINADEEDPDKPQQIWTQGETEASSVWFPTIDAPNERCTQEISITVANKFNTLSNGLLVESVENQDSTRTDTWVMDQPHAPYLFMMVVGEYAVVKDQWGELPLAYHVESAYEDFADDIFGNTPEMIQYFSEMLGYPFPWPKYDQVIVRDYVSGAMENTTASVFMDRLQVTDKELIDYNWDDIIAHELFHQWFGDLVTCESWSNLTLNEGFASYSEYLWNEYKYGVDEADYKLQISSEQYFAEAEEEQKDLIRYYYLDREDMFDGHSYNKGAAVLHMLRSYLGDDAFFAGLNKYLTDNAYSTVELADLRLAFEAVVGEDLNWFFDQWFFFSGHPELAITQTYENDTLSLTIQQLQEGDLPVYQLPVFVEIWSGGKSQNYPLVIEEGLETYQFYMEQQPDLVVFDSERQLLAKVVHAKSEEELLFQINNSKSLGSRLEVMDALADIEDKKIKEQIVTKALQDPYYIIRQAAIEYLYDNKVKPKAIVPLVELAMDDEVSHVRSYAIGYLAEQDYKKYAPRVKSALSDKSYMVQGVALTSMVEHEEDITPVIERFKDEKSVHIVLPVSAYYLTQATEESFDWFEGKIEVLDSDALYYFIQVYSQKLFDANEDRRVRAVDLFYDLANDDGDYLTRLSGYQGLLLLTDIEGVDQKLEKIKKTEEDPRLIELYEQF